MEDFKIFQRTFIPYTTCPVALSIALQAACDSTTTSCSTYNIYTVQNVLHEDVLMGPDNG